MEMDFNSLYEYGFWSIFYWFIAIVMSIFWGVYGIVDEAYNATEVEIITERQGKIFHITKTQTKHIEKMKNPKISWKAIGTMHSIGAFVSDFVWSIMGWSALYVLLSQYQCEKLVHLNIFLGIVAVVGITGYGFKIPEKIKIGH